MIMCKKLLGHSLQWEKWAHLWPVESQKWMKWSIPFVFKVELGTNLHSSKNQNFTYFKYNIICHIKFCIVRVLNRVVQLNVIAVQGLHLKGFVRKWIRNILDSPLINLVTRYSFYSCNLYLRPFLSGYFSDWKSYDDIKRLCRVHGHGFKHYG